MTATRALRPGRSSAPLARSRVPVLGGLLGLLCAGLACSSTSTHALLTRPMADPAGLIRSQNDIQDLGTVKGRACRYFILAILPLGNSSLGNALDNALDESGGDAIVNASVTSSLYGFIPYYNLLAFTCTTVQGVAIKITAHTQAAATAQPASPQAANPADEPHRAPGERDAPGAASVTGASVATGGADEPGKSGAAPDSATRPASDAAFDELDRTTSP